jgi:CYTH domain
LAKGRIESGPFESEVAFLITDKGDDIAKDIAGLTSILEYDLRPRPIHRIRDTYYDTRLGLLRKKGTGLRIRRIDGNLLVSMKSNPQRMQGEGVRRIEIEAPWSPLTLAMVQEMLKNSPSKGNPHFSARSPDDAFASMGLVITQERTTRRTVRDIIRHDRPTSAPIAELGIDTVTFLCEPKVRIFEVEIEAKGDRSLRRVQEIAETIQSAYSGFLREWPYGKLATGLAIQQLLKSGVLQSYLKHGRLEAGAFPVIEKSILSNILRTKSGAD